MTTETERVWTDQLLTDPHAVQDKRERVRTMFNAIAPRYELVNRVFSLGRDGYWRRRAVSLAKVHAEDDVLDIACGTGDFARAFHAAGPRSVTGCDFAEDMVRLARERSPDSIEFREADALALPFPDASFSIVSCAFGVRNLQDLDAGFREMHRVLRPGGQAVILEFTRPENRVLRGLYEFYCHRIMPFGATWISGDRTGAYRYLPRSVVSFADASEMADRLRQAGFQRCAWTPLTFGAVTVLIAQRKSHE
ncbi:MAG: bifunctional demethylmenaquinone methyltransferase/2-methoxy-6-polyprenyl-1,4-benzoquinol methylase UbiE [Phycisphaerae bacterium]|nr:bifunctional demethylmenaquinone methyltransferase/2-methoxy-6-polyprenyl-1,4-benzoquinol methylase UbiE [Phycisphaerae bacterium]